MNYEPQKRDWSDSHARATKEFGNTDLHHLVQIQSAATINGVIPKLHEIGPNSTLPFYGENPTPSPRLFSWIPMGKRTR